MLDTHINEQLNELEEVYHNEGGFASANSHCHNNNHDNGSRNGLASVRYIEECSDNPAFCIVGTETNCPKCDTNYPKCDIRRNPDEHLHAILDTQHTGITLQGRFFKVSGVNSRVQWKPQTSSKRRGKVSSFSRKSRKRLLDLFHTLNSEKFYRVKFLTLTLPDEHQYKDVETAKRFFRAFLERLRRRSPRSSAIWRLEFQQNGTPHFHLVMFGVRYWKQANIVKTWGQIIGYEKPIVDIRQVKSFKHLMRYVSKYVAKMPNPSSIEKSEGVAETPSLDIAPYLHAQELEPILEGETPIHPSLEAEEDEPSIGRFWGIFQKVHLPIADKITFSIDSKRVIADRLRRYARRYFKGLNRRRQGFTLYVENIEQWYRLIEFECQKYLSETIYDYIGEVILP